MKIGDLKYLNKQDLNSVYHTVDRATERLLDQLTDEECGAIDIARFVLAKQIPMKPYESLEMLQCPICHRTLTKISCVKKMYAYCPKCGQRLDWD